MATLLTTSLQKIANAVTDSQPAVALLGFAGEPTFFRAWKGQHSADEVYLSGGAFDRPVSGTSTDCAPALAVVDVYAVQTLYLAWKVAGQNTVEVRQYVLGVDGFPVDTGQWERLPVAAGQSSNPAASTDVSPAMAVGANNQLYMVWKTPGDNAPFQWSVYDGNGWSSPLAIPVAKSNQHAALAAWNTSGPGNVQPLCMAWKGAETDDVSWSFFTPGSPTLTQNHVPGASTDAGPALATGPAGAESSCYLVWKAKGEGSLSFALVNGLTSSEIDTLPQVKTDFGPAAVDYSNNTSGFGAQVFDDLIVAFTDQKTGDVWQGTWTPVPDPAPLPGAPGLEGVHNYIICKGTNCELLNKVVVTIDVTEAITCKLGYTIQLNANSPLKFKNYEFCSWQQCGFGVDPNGQLWCWINNYTPSNGPSSNTPDRKPFILKQLGAPSIPKGYKLVIALEYDGDLNVTASKFTVVDDKGKAKSHTIIYTKQSLTVNNAAAGALVTSEYLGPNAAFQINIVGIEPLGNAPNGANANFTSGLGTITYAAQGPLTALGSIPSCANQTNTGERSNMLYSLLPARPSNPLIQVFCAADGPSKNGEP